MPKLALTDAAIKRLKPPAEGQTDIFDAGYPGFGLRLSYGGNRTFFYMYRRNGKLRRLTLGAYTQLRSDADKKEPRLGEPLGLAEARQLWRSVREEVQAGRDPGAVKVGEAAPSDFQAVLDLWLKRTQTGNRSKDAVARIIKKDCECWYRRPIQDIRFDEIVGVLDSAVDRGAPILARRLHTALGGLFKFAKQRRFIAVNHMLDVTKPGSKETPRDRVLNDDEIKAVWKASGEIGYPFGDAVKLLILTGARRGEIGDLAWHEVDLDAKEIRLPGARTKNGRAHTLPLSAPALAILEAVPRIQDCTCVFTTTGKEPVKGWARIKQKLDETIGFDNWVLHDLRRTLATNMQKLGVRLEVTENILNHTSGSRSGVVAVYQQYGFGDEMRAALEAWGAKVVALIEGPTSAKVLPIRGKR